MVSLSELQNCFAGAKQMCFVKLHENASTKQIIYYYIGNFFEFQAQFPKRQITRKLLSVSHNFQL